MVIAIDTGNKNIKTEHFTFVSGLAEKDAEPAFGKKSDWIKYNGKYYVLSEIRAEYLRDKSSSDRYFVLALIGIVKELEYAEKTGSLTYDKDKVYTIKLLTGLPPAHMEDVELRKKYRGYFRMDDAAPVFFNSRTWNIRITGVKIYSQCYAAMLSKPEAMLGRPKVLGIDIGGLTSDYMELSAGRIVPEHTDSLENGVIIFYRAAAGACRRKCDAVIGEADIDAIIRGDKAVDTVYDAEVVKTVNEEARKYVDKFLSTFRELQIDLKNTHVVFMGGGATLLWDFIKESPLLRSYDIIPDIKANAVGYDFLYKNT